jgi:hypothetical protein
MVRGRASKNGASEHVPGDTRFELLTRQRRVAADAREVQRI